MKNKSAHGFIFLKYTLFFVLLFLLSKCVLNGAGTNFALAFLWALVWCNQNIYVLSVSCAAAAFMAGLPVLTVAVFAACCLMLCCAFFIHKTIRKKLNMPLLNIYLFVSQLPFFFLANNTAFVSHLAINIVLTQIFFISAVNFMQPALLRKTKFKLNVDEILSGIVLLIMFASGLSQIKISHAHIGAVFVYLIILLATFSFKNFTAIVAACIFGIGYLVAGEGTAMLTMFVCFALAAFAFCRVGKYYSLVASLLVAACLIFFFKVVSNAAYINAIVPAISILLFLLIPNAYLVLANQIFVPQNKTATEQLAAYSKRAMQKKLFQASECFLAMEKVFKKNIRQTVDIEDAKKVLKTELINGVCKKCPKHNLCHSSSDVPNTIGKIVNNSLVRGKATILDVPPFLTTKCKNIGDVINSSNELALKYLKFNSLQKNSNAGTEIIAEQMKELSSTVMRLSENISKKQIYNTELSSRIEAALIYANLPAIEIVCEENGMEEFLITAVFKKGEYINEKTLEEIISKTASCKMEIVQKSGDDLPENSFVLAACPPVDVVFGLAAAVKTGSTQGGDCHAFMRLNKGKVLFALCDGMGSGEKANRISKEAIELIETFYNAGFESTIILESVNKLLSLGGGEDFVAIDIGVVDLFESSAKFFKLASPESIIASENGFDVVEGGALPIGASIEIQPKIESRIISSGDMIVAFTDGIRDVFSSTAEITNLIEQINTVNPQTLADEILSFVKAKNAGTLNDDSTIICIRIFNKI